MRPGTCVAILSNMQSLRSNRVSRVRRAIPCAAAVLILLGMAPGTQAQSVRTPDKGVIGYGGNLGVLFPDDAFENTLTIDGFGEYYVTPRVSVRTTLAFESPGLNGRTEDHFREVKLLFAGVYNWEKGSWRPFATFGTGFYFVRLHLENTTDPPGETRGGINLGGGTEFILNHESSIKTELRWDIVSHPFPLPDATGATLTFGYKRYF
jgi:hypothetical protein